MVSKRLWVSACVLALVLAGGVWAQEDAVVKSIRDKWDPVKQSVKDMTMTAAMDAQTPEGAMAVEMTIKRKGDKVRTEMNMNGMTMVSIYDGKDSWMVSPMGIQKAPANQPNPGQSMKDSLPDDAKVTGSAKVSGRDCYVIEYKQAQNGNPVKVWVDKKTLTPRQVRDARRQEGVHRPLLRSPQGQRQLRSPVQDRDAPGRQVHGDRHDQERCRQHRYRR